MTLEEIKSLVSDDRYSDAELLEALIQLENLVNICLELGEEN